MVKRMHLGIRLPGFDSVICHLLCDPEHITVPHFLIYKMGIMMVPNS